MNNNDRYNNILAIIAITKFATLLFILILIFNAPYNGTNYMNHAQLNYHNISYIFIIIVFIMVAYLF